MGDEEYKGHAAIFSHCNSLIEQRSAETTAKLMHVQVNGLPGTGVRGRHVNYNAHYTCASCGRGHRDMHRKIC